MARGGPDASWLDTRLQTDRLEFLDRDDVPDRIKQQVVRALDELGRRTRLNEKFAHLALQQVEAVSNPKILELGSAHGGLSRAILATHPTARVTVTDLDPVSVANIADSDLGSHPRATVRVEDATAISANDNSYDLVVFAQAFHHLPPAIASAAIGEATRVGAKFFIIDLPRLSPLQLLLHILTLSTVQLPRIGYPAVHDGVISFLRAYSPAAFSALADHAGYEITAQFGRRRLTRAMPPYQLVTLTRAPIVNS
ncbi:hypothetical protein BKG84_10935 [Mycobacteroides chelonae]|uniref:Methyltransferase domain-containing protein n=2 Tax=Mycobacteroides chelonae TaxID=1774 RepID=A0A1S1M8I9_MYCCH|nr:hypothetical protein BKG84_10935 [Mycobacteroides chelonae]